MYQDLDEHRTLVEENLLALAVGENCLTWMRQLQPIDNEKRVNSLAVKILEEIQSVLDDSSYHDPECFAQIERIVSIFRAYGIPTERHIEYD